MKKLSEMLFGSDPEGKLNIFPFTEKEKQYCEVIRQEILKYLEPNFKILEVACGNGWASIPLIKKGYDIIMSDIECSRVKQKANLKKLKAKIVRCDAENLPFLQNSFDLIFCISGLHHFKNPERAIKEFRRVLKKSGKVLIIEKNYLNPLPWITDIIFNLRYKTKEKTLTKFQIIKYLKKAGFSHFETKLVKTSFMPLSCPILYVAD